MSNPGRMPPTLPSLLVAPLELPTVFRLGRYIFSAPIDASLQTQGNNGYTVFLRFYALDPEFWFKVQGIELHCPVSTRDCEDD